MSSKAEVSVIGTGAQGGGLVNTGFDSRITYDGSPGDMPSTSFTDDPPKYEEVADATGDADVENVCIEVAKNNNEDEKIIAVLRDVVRKCTNPNPAKRPTAQEVLRMLEEVAPKHMLLDEKHDVSSDDDAENGDLRKLK